MYLFTTDGGYKILVDCGLSYEEGDQIQQNSYFPFDPEDIDIVVLTHAHLDHSGNLPTLINQGFEGQILCTEPTAALTDILLSDSANIQGLKQKIQGKKRKKGKSSENNYIRLYGHKQVMDTMDRIITWPFNIQFEIHKGLSVVFKEAGHILGASSVEIHYTENKKSKVIGFTGDLGNKGSKIIVDPTPMSNLNYLVMESTYGGRYRNEFRRGEEVIESYIRATCIDQPGRLIIPAFSVGRTQAILFVIHKLFEEGKIPRGIRVFADSKMGMFSSGIHQRYSEYLNSEARDFLTDHDSLFRYPELFFIEDDDDRKILENHYEPCIIVSSAGMMEGGRIREHVTNNIQNPACTFLIAGFCAPGTLGDQLLKGNSDVYMKGKSKTVYAKIASTDAFSGHPDHNGLIEYFAQVRKNSALETIFITHGEEDSMNFLKEHLEREGAKVTMPVKGEEIQLR